MALLAVLNHGDPSWNGNYAQIEFHSYNERYEGSYPNLYFYFDVQARIVAINSGWWMIQANTTFNYGGVQQTHGIYTGKVYGTSDWYFVGSHRKQCGCGRSFKFEDGCSVSGYPNLSGRGSITSPTIEAPTFTARAENIDQRTCDIVWDTTDNPYNMYRMYVKYPDGHYSSQLPMDGSYSLEGLNSNTSYAYRVEAWQADGRGGVVAGKDVTFKTLENYPEISVTEVTYEIEDAGETDNVTFRFKSTDDSHVSKWHYQIQGGPPFSGTSPTYSESRLAKNLESYIDVWTEDTLGRTSSKFRQYFHTTFTKMTVWRRMKTNGYQLLDASKIKTKTQGGATVTNNNDGSFTISGNGELSEQFESLASYPITVKAGLLKLDSVNKSCPYTYIDFYDEQGKFVVNISNERSSKSQITISEGQASKIKKMIIYMLGRTKAKIKPGTIKPMLYQNGDGTWEPYTNGKPFDGYLRGFMYCIQNMLWGYARPYILNTGRKWLNALPYDIVRRFVFSGKTNAAGLEVHKIYGNTVQETTKGYQLFDASKVPTKSQGGATVTNNNDGSLTISGSGNISSDYITIVYYGDSSLLKRGNLYYKYEIDTTPIIQVVGCRTKGNANDRVFTLSKDEAVYISDEMLSGIKDVAILVYSNSGVPIKTGTIKPMLYQDGDGAWEPFTGGKAAPNGDYPMEIKNVGITEIKSTGKNLIPFPYDIGGVGSKYTKHGIDFEVMPDKGVKISGTATSVAYINLCVIDFGDTLFLSRTMNATNGYQATLVGNKTGIFLGYNPSNKITSIIINKGVSVNQTVYPMIEKGYLKTEWEAPKGYSTVQKSISLAKDDVYSKDTILRKRKKLVLDGSSDERWLNLVANTRVQCQLDTVIRANYSVNVNGYCNRAVYRKIGNANKLQNNEFTIVSSNDFGGARLIIRIPSDISTLEEWKTWLSTHNLIVEYELATPTTEYVTIPTITSFDPYTNAWTDSEVETQIEWRPAASSTLTERFYAVEQYRKMLNENT